MPTITFYLNDSSIATTVNPTFANPWVKFDSTTKLSNPGGLVQPPNWYYYVLNSGSSETITIKVTAATNYPLPALSFMLMAQEVQVVQVVTVLIVITIGLEVTEVEGVLGQYL